MWGRFQTLFYVYHSAKDKHIVQFLFSFQAESERDAHLMPRMNKSPTPESSPPSSPDPPPRKQPLGFHGAIPAAAGSLQQQESDEETGIIIPPAPVGISMGRDEESDSSNDAQNGAGGYSREASPSPATVHRSQSPSQSSMYYNNGQHSQSAEDVMKTVYKGFSGVGNNSNNGKLESRDNQS